MPTERADSPRRRSERQGRRARTADIRPARRRGRARGLPRGSPRHRAASPLGRAASTPRRGRDRGRSSVRPRRLGVAAAAAPAVGALAREEFGATVRTAARGRVAEHLQRLRIRTVGVVEDIRRVDVLASAACTVAVAGTRLQFGSEFDAGVRGGRFIPRGNSTRHCSRVENSGRVRQHPATLQRRRVATPAFSIQYTCCNSLKLLFREKIRGCNEHEAKRETDENDG